MTAPRAPRARVHTDEVRIVLCENALTWQQGHHFNLALGMKEELAARAIPLTILSNVAIEPALCAELDALPVFEVTPYRSLVAETRHRQIRACLRGAWKFGAALRRVEIGPGDVLLVPTARPAEVLGLAGWSWMKRRRPRATVLNFMTDDFHEARTFTPTRIVQVIYRLGLGLTRLRLGRARVLLTSASESLVSSLSRHLGERVMVSAMLKSYPPARPRTEDAGPVIGFMGTPRPDKGSDLLALAVEACARSCPTARIVVQLPSDFKSPPGGWPANVEVLPVGLERESYFELLGRLDLAVLPYDASRFGDMASGVFAEAVACGSATVVPAGTWMATLLERGRGAGVVFDHFSARSIAEAVARAAGELDSLRRDAARLQEPWRAEQSISAYIERLLEELRIVRSPELPEGVLD